MVQSYAEAKSAYDSTMTLLHATSHNYEQWC